MKNLDSLRPYHCRVTADEETVEDDFIFGSVCNSTSLAGLVKLDPNRVRMDDGVFELVLLRMPRTVLDLTEPAGVAEADAVRRPGHFLPPRLPCDGGDKGRHPLVPGR
ncbi:MAG: hypothetical protein ACLUNQ_08105 [Oscillospiraceae bacterium]